MKIIFSKPGKTSKHRLLWAGAVMVLLAAGVLTVSRPAYVLTITDASSGRRLHERAARPGDNLWICFINSVENLPVADHFSVDARYRLVFTETIFQAPYAGYVRPERGGKTELVAPGTTRISGYNREMEEVTFFAGYVSRHLLFLNGHWLSLYEAAKGGDLIRIRVEKRAAWRSIFKTDRITGWTR